VYVRKMSEKSHVEPLGMSLLDPASNRDMIKVGKKANSYAPVADRSTGETRKTIVHCDQGTTRYYTLRQCRAEQSSAVTAV
jgi:hypothetical protein